MNKLKFTLLTTSLALALSATSTVSASAFQLFEQDAGGIGESHAGAGAKADSAAIEWYNPAGMVNLTQQQISTGLTVAKTNIPYKGTVAVNTAQDPTPQAVDVQGGGFNYIPNFHFVMPLEGQGAFGIGINVPFGLQTDYQPGTPLQYVGTLTSIQAIDITPAFAFMIMPRVSFGFGVDVATVSGEFDQYTTLGTGTDTTSTNKGTGTAEGFHTGLMFMPDVNTRIGLAYHSGMDVHLTGSSTFTGPLANEGAGGQQTNNGFYTELSLPAWSQLSFFHQFKSAFAVLASVAYTEWNTFDQVNLQNVVTPFSDSDVVTVPENYKNTWNFAMATDYQLSTAWALKFGTSYDMTPSNAQDRNIQLPDSNRISLSAGADYQLSNTLKLSAGYMHIFAQTAVINNTQQLPASVVVATDGNVKGGADIFGMQVNWKF